MVKQHGAFPIYDLLGDLPKMVYNYFDEEWDIARMLDQAVP